MRKTRQRGWWYPWIFVGGMGIVIVVNAVLLFLAISTFPGFETRDHYERGLAYNDALEGTRAQAALGWSSDIRFEASTANETESVERSEGPQQGVLVAIVTDRSGARLQDLEVRIRLVRPTHDGFDMETTMTHRGNGSYASAIDLPLPGQWDAELIARNEDAVFQEVRRLFVP
jgi:nitrogen fixation protein FixH